MVMINSYERAIANIYKIIYFGHLKKAGEYRRKAMVGNLSPIDRKYTILMCKWYIERAKEIREQDFPLYTNSAKMQ